MNKLLELLQTYEHDFAVCKELKEEIKDWIQKIDHEIYGLTLCMPITALFIAAFKDWIEDE